jgi:microcystin-dependent protein
MGRARDIANVLSTNSSLVYSTDLLNNLPIGTIMTYSASTSLTNWLICDGSAISRTTYSSLFSLIGTTYGIGNNSTTFNLPDLKGKTLVGFNSSELEFNSLGKTGGSKTHTLTSAEMPIHSHTQDPHGHVISANSFAGDRQIVMGPLGGDGDKYGIADSNSDISSNTAVVYARNTTATNQNTGGGGSHNNLQPYMALSYIIKAL